MPHNHLRDIPGNGEWKKEVSGTHHRNMRTQEACLPASNGKGGSGITREKRGEKAGT